MAHLLFNDEINCDKFFRTKWWGKEKIPTNLSRKKCQPWKLSYC